MITNLVDSSTIPLLEQVVNFSQTRHGVLAGNLANLDTPGYQVRDLSPSAFEARLKQAVVERDSMRTPLSRADASSPAENPLGEVSGDLENFLYHDTSTGNLESQVTAITKNQMQHNLALSIMTSQFRLLQTAISERL